MTIPLTHNERPMLPLNFKMVLGVANMLIAIHKFYKRLQSNDISPCSNKPVEDDECHRHDTNLALWRWLRWFIGTDSTRFCFCAIVLRWRPQKWLSFRILEVVRLHHSHSRRHAARSRFDVVARFGERPGVRQLRFGLTFCLVCCSVCHRWSHSTNIKPNRNSN